MFRPWAFFGIVSQVWKDPAMFRTIRHISSSWKITSEAGFPLACKSSHESIFFGRILLKSVQCTVWFEVQKKTSKLSIRANFLCYWSYFLRTIYTCNLMPRSDNSFSFLKRSAKPLNYSARKANSQAKRWRPWGLLGRQYSVGLSSWIAWPRNRKSLFATMFGSLLAPNEWS